MDASSKACSKCGQVKSLLQFKKDPRYKGGHIGQCSACRNARRREITNPERERVRQKEWRENNPEKEKAKHQRYKQRHPERVRSQIKSWRRRNQEHESKYAYDYNRSDAGRARMARWRRTPKGRVSGKVHQLKRYMAKKQLPFFWTPQDWQRALEYFQGRCAVCERQMRDLFATHRPAADHWIALTDPRPDNPGTVPWNIVPLCHGLDGCNNSKYNRNASEWLIERYGARKAEKILARIQAYFDWAKSR